MKTAIWTVVVLTVLACLYIAVQSGTNRLRLDTDHAKRAVDNSGLQHDTRDRSSTAEVETSLVAREGQQTATSNIGTTMVTSSRSAQRATLTEIEGAGGATLNLLHAGLSPSEVRWMNRNGVPAPSDRSSGYTQLSVLKLEALAKAGDPRAATVGAYKAMTAAYQTDAGRAALDLLSRVDANQIAGPAWETRDQTMNALFSTDEWVRQRDILWAGVVHGSSFSAVMMARTYTDTANLCYQPAMCIGWLMVAWRMGEWQIGAQSEFELPPGDVLSLYQSFVEANVLWTDINTARDKLGLEPLTIDLRPNFPAWHSLFERRIQGLPAQRIPVYPR